MHEPSSFDEAVEAAEHLFIEAYLKATRVERQISGNEVSGKALLAGLSVERNSYELYRIWTKDGSNDDQAFRLQKIDHYFYASSHGGAPMADFGFNTELVERGLQDPNIMMEACVRAVCAGR